MRLLVLCTLLLLTSCTTTRAIPEFIPPDVPAILMQEPEKMIPITKPGQPLSPVKANDALKIIIHNYMTGVLNTEQLVALQNYINEFQKAVVEYNAKLKK